MNVLWVTRAASLAGGAERHIADVVPLLDARGVRSRLLHDPALPADPAFTGRFQGAFPWADVARQVAALAPDVLYLHQVPGDVVAAVADTGTPAVRFFHDHEPFCLRSHKYSPLTHRTCTRPLGVHCWLCLGFVNRSEGFPPFRLRTLGRARADLDRNRRLSAFAVGSLYMKDHVVAHGFSPASVRVLPMFSALPDRWPPKTRDPDLLLFVGALLLGKGLDLLLDALALLPPTVRLRVAGGGHQEARFRAQADALGLGSRVEFLGRQSREALEVLYRQAACVVVPSREPETFGLVGLEAYRHGTPVVAARVGGIGEWLIDGRTGLAVPSGDAGALADALRRVLGDPAAAARMGAAGRDLLCTRFTPERHTDALVDLLGWAAAHGRES